MANRPDDAWDALAALEPLVELIAARVVAKLAATSTTGGDHYTTRKGGPHIPGKSRDWMRRHVKTMPGSRKVGRDWVIRRADYDGWATARDESRAVTTRPSAAVVMDDEEYARAAIAAAGYRVPKRVA